MRKNINGIIDVALVVILVAVIALVIHLTACTASFRRGMKDWSSDVSGGLNRTVTAYSNTGEKIGEWSGKIDIEYDDNKVKFDLQGKRVIITGGIVIAEEK